MTKEKENETPKGLKFTVNHGGQAEQPVHSENKKEKIEEEKDNAITNTARGTRGKN